MSGSAGGEALCPSCGAAPVAGVRFCENCGYDTRTGKIPVLAAAAPAPAAGWTATVAADEEYFRINAVDGVEFPAGTPPRTVALPPPQVRIGRRSRSAAAVPDLDLSADPGVSHHHALLTLSVDGVWLLSDLDSTNGTWVNDEPQPVPPGRSRPLAAGDRVHVGAWTTITLHGPG